VNRDAKRLKPLYQQMLLIRRAEERLQKLFADGEVPGFLHLSIGQEAVPAGVSASLIETDTVSSNHRGHGHALAKGLSLSGFFAEVMGRDSGVCRGRGGSMHVADLSIGMLGANGIVGAGLPITTGSALALKIRGKGDIAAVYFGDGALAEGVVHECFNLAALWSLPVLFICENNGWSEFSPVERQLATNLKDLTAAYSIDYATVDGNDVLQVADAAERIIRTMRKQGKPHVLECRTTRVRGHFEGDKQDYRDPDEVAALSARDPIAGAREKLVALGSDAEWFDAQQAAVDAEIEAAVSAARAAAEPALDSILADVYTPSLPTAHTEAS